jgi:hypothetical protein
MSFAVTAVVTTAVGVGYSIYAGERARDDAKDAGAAQAATEREVTKERIRQIAREEMLTREATVAATAGSGVKIGSQSTLAVLADQAAEFKREKAITEKVGASAAKAALAEGSAVGSQYRAQGISSAISGVASIFSILGNR